MIHCSVVDNHSGYIWSVVYGLHTVEDKKSLWVELADLDIMTIVPWCFLVDFNVVISCNGVVNGKDVSSCEAQDVANLLL